ncbi:hypothetical protein HDU67_007773 [Dinochytrium kinnereticum]|nr:hypothetical protein HDU67_007773 [Dinochytrium kinnereticum]
MVAALIAQKRAEIAAKMAAFKDRPAGAAAAINSNPSTPASSSSSRAATSFKIPATATSSSSSLRRAVDAPDDLRKRISEVTSRIQAFSKGGGPTQSSGAVAASDASSQLGALDKSKKGLKMEVHPLFELAGKTTDSSEIRTFIPKANFATAKANQRLPDKAAMSAAAAAAAKALEKVKANKEAEAAQVVEVKKELALLEPPPELFDPVKNPYFDPNISAKSSLPKARVAGKGFRFIQKGKFVDQANKLRQQALLEKLKADIAATVKKAGMEVELDLVSDLSVRREPPPAVEWWDAPIVGSEGSYESFDLSNIADGFITNLVQHPVPIQPSAELGAPPPKPLMLTKKERKKLRRQRRQEAQKETRDKVRLGLIPPEQPKLKISNLMRVLGTDAVQDPTKIEALVRAQMRQRQAKQQKYLAENKLTKEQRRERKRLKLTENTHVFIEVAVFKVNRLTNPSHKFKVEMNANQLNLSGVVILYPSMSVVVVEGGNRGMKQYKKLMMRRINWASGSAEDAEEEGEGEESGSKEKPNECALVWEGKNKRRLFQGFKVRQCASEREVRDVLEKAGAMQYWDAAKHYVAPTAG